MIINAVWSALCDMVASGLSILPSSAPFSPDLSAIQGFINQLDSWNSYLPIVQLLEAVGIMLTIVALRFAIQPFLMVFKLVRG